MIGLFQKKSKNLSQRLIIRPQLSWQNRLAIALIGGVLLSALCWGAYEVGKRNAIEQLDGDEQSERIIDIDSEPSYVFDPGMCRQTKKQMLCGEIGALTQQLQINTTANQSLAGQVESLVKENDQLKEKLAFLKHLVSGNNKGGISVYQFSLKETSMPGIYRYTVILLQDGEKNEDFKGNLRFQVKLQQNNRSKTVPLVTQNAKHDFSVNFKSFYRFEETFKVPDNTVVENIQVQIFKNGEKRALLTEITKPVL